MKLRELIARVDKSDVNRDTVYVGALAEQMEITDVGHWTEEPRLKAYWLMKWYDSGNYCGLQVVFLNDEPVATWSIPYGKSDGVVEWLSDESYKKTRAFVLTFQEPWQPGYALKDQEEECGETYSLHYTEQVMPCHTNSGFYNGEAVQIIKPKPGTKRDILDHIVTVVNAKNERQEVSVRDIKYPYHTTDRKTESLGEF